MKCQHCGSTRIIPRATIMDRTQYGEQMLEAYVCAKPDAIFFRETEYGTLYARICGDCGATDIFTDNAAALYEAYVASRQVE